MQNDTNAAVRTLRGNPYDLRFMGDKGKAWQYLVSRQTLLIERIEANQQRLRQGHCEGLDLSLAVEWLREDQQELSRVRQGLHYGVDG